MTVIEKIENLLRRNIPALEICEILSISLVTVNEVSRNIPDIEDIEQLPTLRDSCPKNNVKVEDSSHDSLLQDDRTHYKEALDRYALGVQGSSKDQLAALKIIFDTYKIKDKSSLAEAVSKHPVDNRKTVINFNMNLKEGRNVPNKSHGNIPAVKIPKIINI